MSTLALHLVPQALPLSIPIGLTFGILCGLGRVSASYRSRAVILSLAAAASFVSFTMLAWVVPMANQAFRVAIAGQPLAKGSRELTLGELRMAPAMTLRLHHTSAFAAAWCRTSPF